MRIGYACLAVGVRDTKMSTCVAKNASEEKLKELIKANLLSLERLIDYNIEHNIKLFRISSDIIPFGSSPVNTIPWWEIFEKEFQVIGEKIKKSKMRVSMHPGQYTVLNSPDKDIVTRAMLDLEYHAKVLDSLQTGKEHKMILHIGGRYDSKEEAIKRFMKNYELLDSSVKDRLVIENDEKLYHIQDVLEIGRKLGIPVVFDNLHHATNCFTSEKSEEDWIYECLETWKLEDGTQKIHYSQQDFTKKPGAHSNTIEVKKFIEFCEKIAREDLDIMLEVKDKNLSAIKCRNAINPSGKMKELELEWSRYKYTILEKSHTSYNEIRQLLKDKKRYPVIPFYEIVESAIKEPETMGNAVNAVQHVWGYLKDIATLGEKEKFHKSMEQYQEGKIALASIKRQLFKLAEKYQELYLLDSYYFSL